MYNTSEAEEMVSENDNIVFPDMQTLKYRARAASDNPGHSGRDPARILNGYVPIS